MCTRNIANKHGILKGTRTAGGRPPCGALHAHRMKFITNRITCKMSTISSIMVIVRMTSFSSSQVQLLFRTFATTIHTADRTGLLSAEKCRRHLSAGTDSGRAGLFYHIATSCSSPAEESLLSCCYSGRIFSKCSCINAPDRCTLNRR